MTMTTKTTKTAKLSTLTKAIVTVGKANDDARNAAIKPLGAWVGFVAERLVGDKPSLTIEAVENEVLLQCLAIASPKQRKNIGSFGTLAKNGFSTVYGWVNSLKRVHAAGLTVELLPSATSYNGGPYPLGKLAATVQARQPKAKGRTGRKLDKTPKGSASAPAAPASPEAPSSELSFGQVAKWLEKAAKLPADVLTDEHQADIGRVIAAASKMQRAVEKCVSERLALKATKARNAASSRKVASRRRKAA
jgi:hypothetical protein